MKTAAMLMVSRDERRSWSAPRTIARTGDASITSLLIANGPTVFLSSQTTSAQ